MLLPPSLLLLATTTTTVAMISIGYDIIVKFFKKRIINVPFFSHVN